MSNHSEHSPLPWASTIIDHYDEEDDSEGDGHPTSHCHGLRSNQTKDIADNMTSEDAYFAARAVNNFGPMLETLKAVVSCHDTDSPSGEMTVMPMVRSAIAAAEACRLDSTGVKT